VNATFPIAACRVVLPGLLFLVLAAAGCQSGPRPTPEFVEQAELLHQNALRQAVVGDRDLNDYFAEIGKRVVAGATAANPANTRDPTFAAMQFHLVGSDVVNAFGTGGRHVYVYNGLVQACQSEEELAALMAVQYAHALERDVEDTGMRPDVRGGTDRTSVDRVAFQFVTSQFSAEQLLRADRRAFDFYVFGGWDPAKYPLAYERLKSLQRLDLPPTSGGGDDRRPRPTLSARAAAAREAASGPPAKARDRRQPTVADAQTFAELKRTAEGISTRMDGAGRAFLYLAAFPNVVLPGDLPSSSRRRTNCGGTRSPRPRRGRRSSRVESNRGRPHRRVGSAHRPFEGDGGRSPPYDAAARAPRTAIRLGAKRGAGAARAAPAPRSIFDLLVADQLLARSEVVDRVDGGRDLRVPAEPVEVVTFE
jgi:hypothetical protein